MDDGYIKYSSERRNGVVAMSAMLDELNEARTSLVDRNLIGVYPNGVGFGNLSFRTNNNQFVVTASATGGIRTLGNEHYCLVEEFSADQNYVRSVGLLPASSEALTHGAIYAANPTVRLPILRTARLQWPMLCRAWLLDNTHFPCYLRWQGMMRESSPTGQTLPPPTLYCSTNCRDRRHHDKDRNHRRQRSGQPRYFGASA